MWSGREVRGWGLGCRDKEGLLGTIRGVVAPWPCAEHIYIDFRAWDWHLGAVRRPPACCYVLCLFNFGSFSSFARPIHFFFLYCVLWVHNKLSRNCISEINSFMYVNRLLQWARDPNIAHIAARIGEVCLWQGFWPVGGRGLIMLGLFNYGQKSVCSRLKWNFQQQDVNSLYAVSSGLNESVGGYLRHC